MAVTVKGAIRQKKLIEGQEIKISGEGMDLDCPAKVASIQEDAILLELFATAIYPHEKLRQQKEISVHFVVPDDAVYTFTGAVGSYNDLAQILLVEHPSPLKRVEQRGNFRLKTAKTLYFAFTEDMGSGFDCEKWVEASLLDISRSGASLLSPVYLEQKSKVKLLIPLDEVAHRIETMATVAHARQKDGQALLGLNFEGLSLQDQERLLEFMLKEWTGRKEEQDTA